MAPRFVGRDEELAALAGALAVPSLVLIEGEAGIGKSRLVREVADTGTSRMLVGGAPPYRQPFTLGPVVDAVRQASGGIAGLALSPLAGALRPLFPEWAADLPSAPEQAEDQLAARYRLFRALAELLTALDVDVLVVEDAHWADETTLEFLLFLAAQQVSPVSLLLTYRPEDVPDDSLLLRLSSRSLAGRAGLRVSLGPLNVSDTAALVSSMLADEYVSPEFAEFLHDRTDGVPLAIEESVRLMRDRADLVRRRGEYRRLRLDDIHLPPTVRDAVLERVRRLDADARAVLQAAAVLADAAQPAALLAVAGLPPENTGWVTTLDSGLLTESPTGLLEFRHALAARAVYEAVPAGERRGLHRRAAEYLEALPSAPAAALARHFRAAGDTQRWCRYTEQAAGMALAAGDDVSSVTLLHDLLVHADLPADTVLTLMERMPLVALNNDQLPGAADVLRRAIVSDTLNQRQVARVRFLLSVVLEIMNEHDASRAELAAAVPDLVPGSPESVEAMLLLGWPRGTVWTREVHLSWLRRAAEAIELLPPAHRADFTGKLAAGLLQVDDESGFAYAARITDGPGTANRHAIVLRDLNLGELAMRWGRQAEARERLVRALELTETHQYDRHGDTIRGTIAHLDWYEGRWAGLAERARALCGADRQMPGMRLEFALVAALVLATTGNRALAEPSVMRIVAELRRRGSIDDFSAPAAALARWWLAEGRVEDALRVTEEPVAILVRKGIWHWATDVVPARVDALVAVGRYEDAARLVADFETGLGELAAPAPQAGLMLSRAILASAAGAASVDRACHAAELFGRAAQAWRRMPRPYPALLAEERQAGCLIAAGQESAGRTMLGEVSQRLSELGASVDADRVAQAVRGLAEPSVPRRGRRGYGDQLSPRELDVVRLVITGSTNREIAQALHRSPKTVATQLNSAMRKLKVASRTGLAVAALEAGVTSTE